MAGKRGKPENVLVADLSEEWGSPLAIMSDSCNYIIATQRSDQGKWGGNNNKYYPKSNDGFVHLFRALRAMFVARGTKKAENLAELCEQVANSVTKSNTFIEQVAHKINVGV